MSKKLRKLSDETQELIDKLSKETGLIHKIEIKAFDVPSAKKLIEVKKLQPLGESILGREKVVGIIVYEEAFIRLTPEQQEMLMYDAFTSIKYDFDKDKVVIEAPQIAVTCGCRAKYGEKLVDAAECAVLTIQQIIEEQKEEKERLKKERAEKRCQKKMNK